MLTADVVWIEIVIYQYIAAVCCSLIKMSGLNFWKDQLAIPLWAKTTINTVSWSWLQTFQSRSSASCHLNQKDTFDWLVNTPFQSPIPVSSGRAKQKQYILQILTKSVAKKKKGGGGGSFMIIPYKMTCFYPCHILPWYVTVSSPAFLCPPFLLLAGKDKRHETPPHTHTPFFLSLTRLVKTSRREEVCHFSPNANQQILTASLHWRDHLSLKGPNSSSTFFEKWMLWRDIKSIHCTAYSSCILHSASYFPHLMWKFSPFSFPFL